MEVGGRLLGGVALLRLLLLVAPRPAPPRPPGGELELVHVGPVAPPPPIAASALLMMMMMILHRLGRQRSAVGLYRGGQEPGVPGQLAPPLELPDAEGDAIGQLTGRDEGQDVVARSILTGHDTREERVLGGDGVEERGGQTAIGRCGGEGIVVPSVGVGARNRGKGAAPFLSVVIRRGGRRVVATEGGRGETRSTRGRRGGDAGKV